jgi:hypothetical protein
MRKSAQWFMYIIGFAIAFIVLQRAIPEHFTAPSNQQKATNCPDGTRTTNGKCLMD